MTGTEDITAGALLAQAAQFQPDGVALIEALEPGMEPGMDKRITYAALDSYATTIACWLVQEGLGPGSRIAILSGNCATYAALVFAAARAGTIAIHLSLRASGAEMGQLLSRCGAEILFFGPDVPDQTEMEQCAPGIRRMTFSALVEAAQEASATAALPLLDAAEPYAITFTGGTTGVPKAVLVNHRGRAGQARTIAEAFGLGTDDVVAIATPMFHVAGQFVWFQPAIAACASCVLLGRWDIEGFLQAVSRHQVTAVMLVPTQLIDLLRRGRDLEARMASLKRIVYAGAPMPPAVLDELLLRLPWIEFVENYGQSELGAVTVRRGSDLPAKAGSVGKALPNLKVAVMRQDGGLASPGEPGELVCRGDNHLLAYDSDPVATAALYPYGDGWLATGDVAVIDADGFVTLVDRAKDMIISGGENIYPVEIENVLHRHEAVSECAVVGRADARLGEVPVAFVVRRDDCAVSTEELIAYCLEVLPRHKRPRDVLFLDALPKTAVGKIQKNLLRDAQVATD